MIEDILRQTGLSENEVQIYLTMLPMHKTCASVLANKLGMERNVTRYTCKQLVKKGMVTESLVGQTFEYVAEPPERIIHLLESEKRKIEQKQSSITQFMGVLNAMQNPTMQCPSVKYFEGEDGIKQIYADIIDTGIDHFCWTNLEQKKHIFGSYIDEHVKKRIEKGIKIFAIKSKTKEAEENLKIGGLLREIKLVDELPILNGEIIIYGNKVAIITFKNKKLTGFVFENKEVALMMKGVFNCCWGLIL